MACLAANDEVDAVLNLYIKRNCPPARNYPPARSLTQPVPPPPQQPAALSLVAQQVALLDNDLSDLLSGPPQFSYGLSGLTSVAPPRPVMPPPSSVAGDFDFLNFGNEFQQPAVPSQHAQHASLAHATLQPARVVVPPPPQQQQRGGPIRVRVRVRVRVMSCR